jgi:hypothetical protein
VTTEQAVHLKKAFLEHFRAHGNVSWACRAVGITRRPTVYEWQEHDDEFAAAFREAEIEATETLEQEAYRRAFQGSDTLLIFLLKARAPTKYRDNARIEHAGAVRVQDDRLALLPDDELRRLAEQA